MLVPTKTLKQRKKNIPKKRYLQTNINVFSKNLVSFRNVKKTFYKDH